MPFDQAQGFVDSFTPLYRGGKGSQNSFSTQWPIRLEALSGKPHPSMNGINLKRSIILKLI